MMEPLVPRPPKDPKDAPGKPIRTLLGAQNATKRTEGGDGNVKAWRPSAVLRRLPIISEEDKKPSLEKLVEEREARKQTRSKFHGRALEWSRQGDSEMRIDVKEFAALFDDTPTDRSSS
mmetsp:Transcript_70067/g.154474  ORF Transcript_70067/g.154474 Transcript_70067/m.154474 type:complete len:119 (-) Transcript_70067:29-385(-)